MKVKSLEKKKKKKRKVNFQLAVEESHRMGQFVNIFIAGMCSWDWDACVWLVRKGF